jgi:tRNA pseudouridine13 synthase
MSVNYNFDGLSYAAESPQSTGRIRVFPEDFAVVEELGFTPEGSGEHVFLRVRKRLANTDWVARQLASFAGVPARQVSYAGLKDRYAVTEQWFSVHLPGKPSPDWSLCNDATFSIVEAVRHSRKLKRGALQGNRFCIVIRDLKDPSGKIQWRLDSVMKLGVPNYFGPQRFGREGRNLAQAEAMFSGRSVRDRHRRGLYLSAARAYLFNQVLTQRVAEGTWNQALPGDVMMHDGSRSQFPALEIDEDIFRRTSIMALHPSGPLWGKGECPSRLAVGDLEQKVALLYPLLCQGLEQAGLVQERRPLRLHVQDIKWDLLEKDSLKLMFWLSSGAYATSVLREIIACNEVNET